MTVIIWSANVGMGWEDPSNRTCWEILFHHFFHFYFIFLHFTKTLIRNNQTDRIIQQSQITLINCRLSATQCAINYTTKACSSLSYQSVLEHIPNQLHQYLHNYRSVQGQIFFISFISKYILSQL